MDRIIYTAMTGAGAAAQRQAVLANNLANAATDGFRAEMSTFRAVPLHGSGADTRVFALEATSGHDATPGAAQRTGRALDAMALGNAWFAVLGLDGNEAYTRSGAFDVSQDGQLVSASGLPVLSDSGAPIDIPPQSDVQLAADGTITAQLPGQAPQTVARIKLATPAPDAPLQRGDDGLFRAADGQALAHDAAARLLPGSIEGSNVNTVQTMVEMIAAARQFETQMRLLQTAQGNDKTASQLLGVNT